MSQTATQPQGVLRNDPRGGAGGVNWRFMTIDEVTDRLIDYRGKTPPKTDSGVRLITAKVVKGGRILDENPEFIASEFYDAWMTRGLPQQWDVLITTEAPLGEVAILREPDRIALAQRIILLRGNRDLIDQRYLFYALQSDFTQADLRGRATGTTVSGIKQSELRKVRLQIPPLPTQRRIAGILSAYDDLIENNLRRINILEEMAQSLYREWFVRFRFPGHESARFEDSDIGRVPEGWNVKAVTEVVTIRPKVLIPKGGDIPFVTMGGLSEKSMLITEVESRDSPTGARFQNGDTLFARITPCLENGKTGYVEFLPSDESAACGSTEFIVLRSKTVCPQYVYLMARSDAFRDNAIKSMSGATGRQRVRDECFDQFFLAQPPEDLLARFESITRPQFELIHSLNRRNQTLRRTRELLLPKLLASKK